MAEVSAAERVIVALDVPTVEEAHDLIKSLPKARFFKIGLEAITAGIAHQVLALIQAQGAQAFWDGKFLDIENTVLSAIKALPDGVALFNLHAFAGPGTMQKAARAANARGIKTLAVTVLTDKTPEDLAELGFGQADLKTLVLRLARLARESTHGVVCSPQELPVLRRELPKNFLLVTPGIRPSWAPANDQKRVMPPAEAGFEGADYIVVGRPITAPPEGISTAEAFDRVVEEFAQGIANHGR